MPNDQAIPTEDSDAGRLARMLLRALGPAYSGGDGSRTAADFLALGQALADGRDTNLVALAEAFVDAAADLLTEHERAYGLVPRADLGAEDRRTRLVAKVRAARAGTPQAIARALASIAADAEIFENDRAAAVASGVDHAVYVFAVLVATDVYANSDLLGLVRAIVQQMKPAHSRGNVGTRAGFRCDDPLSLTDRDLLSV